MRIGIILETNEPEKAWNALRFANTAVRQKHDVKVFLMSAGVEVQNIVHEKYNAKKQLDEFLANGAWCSRAAPASRAASRRNRRHARFPP